MMIHEIMKKKGFAVVSVFMPIPIMLFFLLECISRRKNSIA